MKPTLLSALLLLSSVAGWAQKPAPIGPGTSNPSNCKWTPGSSGPSGDPWATLARTYSEACTALGAVKECGDFTLKALKNQGALDSFNLLIKDRNKILQEEMEKGKRYPVLEWRTQPPPPPAVTYGAGQLAAGSKPAVVVTWHLFEFACTDSEVRWVMAHELTHLLNKHHAKTNEKFQADFMEWWNRKDGKWKFEWFEKKRNNQFDSLHDYFEEYAQENDMKKFPLLLNDYVIWHAALSDFIVTDPANNPYASEAIKHKEVMTQFTKDQEAEADKRAEAAVGGGAKALNRLQDMMYAYSANSDPTHGLPSERVAALKKKK